MHKYEKEAKLQVPHCDFVSLCKIFACICAVSSCFCSIDVLFVITRAKDHLLMLGH